MPPVRPSQSKDTPAYCVCCDRVVTDRQHALCCDNCSQWQHRLCNSGVSYAQYQLMKKGDLNIQWHCCKCKCPADSLAQLEDFTLPVGESTHIQTFTSENSLITQDDTSDHQLPDLQPAQNTAMESASHAAIHLSNTSNSDDGTFHITHSFQIPQDNVEDALPDLPIADISASDEPHVTTYQIIPAGTLKGKPLLVDSNGYSYNIKANKNGHPGKTTWRCSIRNRTFTCKATVLQKGNTFTPGLHDHAHQAEPGKQKNYEIVADVKRKASEDVFRSASAIVEEVMTSQLQPTDPEPSRPAPGLLVRRANRLRQALRPTDPQDLHFDLAVNFIPQHYLRNDIAMDGARHLIFATQAQLDILERAKTWYVDATFKIVAAPFHQLFSIHAFIKGDDSDMKQVPLIFVLMSRRRKRDYKAVLESILNMVPNNHVKKVVADFEQAIWRAFRYILPNTTIQGCLFHWAQCIFRKVQDLGLAVAYRENGPMQKFVRKLFALPCLPVEHIRAAFNQLSNEPSTPAVAPLLDYIRDTWIEGDLWPPTSWCIFNQSTRTNNDAEGYHRRINEKARNQAHQLYKLIPLLHAESCLVPLQVQLVKEKKLKKYHRKRAQTTQGRIFSYWRQYEEGTLTTSSLLKKCSRLTAPSL